jgi:hypothetical protein
MRFIGKTPTHYPKEWCYEIRDAAEQTLCQASQILYYMPFAEREAHIVHCFLPR